jgi:hypothetical protein
MGTRSKADKAARSTLVDVGALGPSIRSFQAALFEARLTIFNDFMAELTSDHPPFEAWDTFYDITIDSKMVINPISVYNQTRLVTSLEWAQQLPRLAVDHLLNLVNIVDDPDLIKKARSLVTDYLTGCRDSAAASRALAVLKTEATLSTKSAKEITPDNAEHSP